MKAISGRGNSISTEVVKSRPHFQERQVVGSKTEDMGQALVATLKSICLIFGQ